ncbi:MAG TPA: AMP-binding protein [Pseudomonadales bacterium]
MNSYRPMTASLIEHISRRASHCPDDIALEGLDALSWRALDRAITRALQALKDQPAVIGFLIRNSADWIITDLACLKSGRVALPLPAFFTPDQIQHALDTAGCRCVITDQPERFGNAAPHCWPGLSATQPLTLLQWPETEPVAMPTGTAKITFTSGSTGHPKGVCLSQAALERTAHALNRRMSTVAGGRHLCALPLAVLLENVGGVYRALLADGTVSLWPAEHLGLSGSSYFDANAFYRALATGRAETVIVLPHMLTALAALRLPAPAGLRFMAVGGAPLPVATLLEARRLGYPVYEGYGLSECGSVVSLNAPGIDQPGSIGKPLDHVRVRIVDDEIRVAGNPCLGYIGQPPLTEPLATGDLGRLDNDGFLHIEGRKTNRIVTAFGRNVSPEWVETALLAQPGIRQCFVTGHGQPALGSLILADDQHRVEAAIANANATLPDYAQIRHWCMIDRAFSVDNHCLTANGRLRRAPIESRYRTQIEQLFQTTANTR